MSVCFNAKMDVFARLYYLLHVSDTFRNRLQKNDKNVRYTCMHLVSIFITWLPRSRNMRRGEDNIRHFLDRIQVFCNKLWQFMYISKWFIFVVMKFYVQLFSMWFKARSGHYVHSRQC